MIYHLDLEVCADYISATCALNRKSMFKTFKVCKILRPFAFI